MSEQPADDIAAAQQAAARGGREVPVPQTTTEDYSFVPPAVRVRAKAAAAKALNCILATQLRVPGGEGKGTVLTVWSQQKIR